MRKNKRCLISGASIAGPALGYWLQRFGFDVTIVEIAPSLRKGGYKIDVRGKAVDVLKNMGVYPEARALSVVMEKGTFFNEKGDIIDTISGEYMGMHVGDDIEIWRSDLSEVLYKATSNCCQYIFNDSIKSVKETGQELLIEFASGAIQPFDLLIGADGIHSNVRSLAFGPEALFAHNLGDYFVAICSIETHLAPKYHELFYSKKNCLFNLYSTEEGHAKALFVFRAPGLVYDYKNSAQQKEIVSNIYKDSGWEMPNMLKAMNASPDFYFDVVQQMRMDNWFRGRIIVIGDAAFSPCLASGQGTSTALVGAYVLAKELQLANGDHNQAYPAYERQMRDFISVNQKLGESIIGQMIPKGEPEPWIGASVMEQIQFAANCITLKAF